MQSERIPAEVWHPGHFILEEMQERGWSSRDLALKIGGTAREIAINEVAIDLAIYVDDKNLRLGADLIRDLARAFDVSPEFFQNLENAWLAHGSDGGNA